MNKKKCLIGLVVFVTITTVGMVIMSQTMTTSFRGAFKLLSTRSAAYRSGTGSGGAVAKTGNTSQGAEAGSTGSNTQTAKQAPTTNPPQSATNRPLHCQHCFVTNFTQLVPTPEVCAAGSAKPEMVMLITTSLNGLSQRQAIRDTWVSVTKNNTAHVRHVFLLGTDSAGRVSKEVKAESARYKDMVVSSFVDTYANLTYKTLVGLKYLIEHCGQVRFFLKTDQDMYVMVERILQLAQRNEKTLQTSLGGSCHQTGTPWRNPKSKYFASIQSYPQRLYPGFCSGTGYIGSLSVARKILETSPDIPFFHLEDVYLALVLRHIGYNLTLYPGFVEGTGVCLMGRRAKLVFTIHEVNPEAMRDMWANRCGM